MSADAGKLARSNAAIVNQARNTTILAKTTRPEIGNIVRREPLFVHLDGTPARTVAWISGPAGSGKSTLAASYVEARQYQSAWYQVDSDDEDIAGFFHYLSHAARKIGSAELPSLDALQADNVASFSRKFFRRLFAGITSPTALVFDNLDELPADGPLRIALEAGLAQVPRGCCIIVTSRDEPPATMARMRAGGEMVCIGADDLRVTPEDTAEIAKLRGNPLSAETVGRLQERTHGWVAGVVLMLEHAKIVGRDAEFPGEVTPGIIFDYLAGEIFDRFEPRVQKFYLRVACLPRMTAEIAQALSGEEKAERLLLNLAHNNYFVREIIAKEGRIFQIHPLLRDFLVNRAAVDLPDAVGIPALQRAAALLRISGQIEDAIPLLIECKDWSTVADIIVDFADAMLSQGRRDTLAGWLELLPPDLLEDNPHLLHALAASRIHDSPRTARRQFEKAFAGFRANDNVDGMIRSCCGIIDATILEFDDLSALDRWVDELIGLFKAVTEVDGVATATLIHALLLRDPGNPAVVEWLARAKNSAASTAANALPTMALAMAALLQGDFSTAEAIAGNIITSKSNSLLKIGLALSSALHHVLDGEFSKARLLASEGIAIADAEDIHTYDYWLRAVLTASALSDDDRDGAQRELQSLDVKELRRGDRAIVHYLRGWLAALAGESSAAQREIKTSLVFAMEVGIPWVEWFARLAMLQVLCSAGDLPGAEAQARNLTALMERLASPLLRFSTLLAEASIRIDATGDDGAFLVPLRAGMALGREHAFRCAIGLEPRVVADLCAAALEHDIESEFACNLVRCAHLIPPPSALRLRRWPWSFQIGTLGGFSLLRRSDPIEFSAKGPGRPVELLKVLVALGGQNVRADLLADTLWPRVDADYAHKSFTATLHRLRRIFENEEALVLRDGRLSLNSSLFRLDTWALEQLIAELDARLRVPTEVAEAVPAKLVEEILALYAGPFLPDEAEQPAYIACREQIRARLLRVLTRAARRWEETGRTEATIDCYLRCIDADDLCEPFYRNLMLCYQRHGETAEALATYERLRAVLAARLKSVPSPETQIVYTSLRAATGGSS